MKIKDLLYKIKDSEEKVSFLEKNIIIDKELKEIFINRITKINNTHIIDNKLILKKDFTQKEVSKIKNILDISPALTGGFGGLLIAFIVIHFFDPKGISDLFIYVPPTVILFLFSSFLWRKSSKKIKTIQEDFYNPDSLTPTQYMYKHYKDNIRQVTIDFINEIESINEPELEKNKKYLSDYIAVKAFEHLEDKENTIFDEIYDQIKEKIFISNAPLNSKKILLEESLKYKNETQLNMPTIEEIKKTLVAAEKKRKLLDFKEI